MPHLKKKRLQTFGVCNTCSFSTAKMVKRTRLNVTFNYVACLVKVTALSNQKQLISTQLLKRVSKRKMFKIQNEVYSIVFILYQFSSEGRDSSVGIATRYELDGPWIESRWERDFQHPSRPALGPTQPPVQGVPGLPRGKSGRGLVLTTHHHLSAEVMKGWSYTSTHPLALRGLL